MPVHFIIDADLPRSIADMLRSSGYLATDVRDVGLGKATDLQIAHCARENGMAILTGDGDFGDIRQFPPEHYHGIVVLDLQPTDTRATIENLIASFLKMPDLIEHLAGRLAVVERDRVRIRPRLVVDGG